MSISNTTENAILNLIFSATAWANYADNAASTPQTNVHTALHTADPGDAGTMSTSEAAYTGYSRQNVARAAGWSTASAGSVSPASNIAFGAWSSGSETETYWSCGKTGGGATAILFSGAIAPTIVVGTGVNATLTTATTVTLD